jgi:hypothetical protein
MSITPYLPDQKRQGSGFTWVSSQYKFMGLPGQLSVQSSNPRHSGASGPRQTYDHRPVHPCRDKDDQGHREYPSRSSGVLSPFSVCFDQCVCELDEFAHDRCNGDLRWFAFCDHILVFGAHIRVVFGRDESWHVERVAQRFSPTLNARFATPLS